MSSEALEKDYIWTPSALYDAETTDYTGNGLTRTAVTTVRPSLFALPFFNYSLSYFQDACSPDGVVQRRLKARHVQMVG